MHTKEYKEGRTLTSISASFLLSFVDKKVLIFLSKYTSIRGSNASQFL